MSNGDVLAESFLPDGGKPRPSGEPEASVNLEDDDGAIAALDAQNSAHGAARFGCELVRLHLGAKGSTPPLGGSCYLQRTPMRKNFYHGDLVFKPLQKKQLKFVANFLAVNSSYIPPKK